MRARLAASSLVVLPAAVSSAQNLRKLARLKPTIGELFGFVTDRKCPMESSLSLEQSNYKITFARGDRVYINRGQDKGVRVGDRFPLWRPVTGPHACEVKWQSKLMRAMGRLIRFGARRVVTFSPRSRLREVTLFLRVHASARHTASRSGPPGAPSRIQPRSTICSAAATGGDGGEDGFHAAFREEPAIYVNPRD